MPASHSGHACLPRPTGNQFHHAASQTSARSHPLGPCIPSHTHTIRRQALNHASSITARLHDAFDFTTRVHNKQNPAPLMHSTQHPTNMALSMHASCAQRASIMDQYAYITRLPYMTPSTSHACNLYQYASWLRARRRSMSFSGPQHTCQHHGPS